MNHHRCALRTVASRRSSSVPIPSGLLTERAVEIGARLLDDPPIQAVAFVDFTINAGRAAFDQDQAVPGVVRLVIVAMRLLFGRD